MSNHDEVSYVIVASYSTSSEALMAVSVLEGSGLKASILNQHTVEFNWLLSNAVGGVQVIVQENELELAKNLLGSPDNEESILRCPRCGSKNQKVRPLSVLGAIGIVLKLPLVLRSVSVDCLKCGSVHSRHIAANDL